MSPEYSPLFVASLVHTLPSEFPARIILLEVGGEVELPVVGGTSREVTVTALGGRGRRIGQGGDGEEERSGEETLISDDKVVPEKT